MDTERMLELQRLGIEAWIRMLGASAPRGEVLESGGVVAAVVPECRQRSIANSGIYRDAEGLERALPRLAEAYERAGIAASAIWTVDPDPAAAAALERNGYVLDGEPAAMHANLAEVGKTDLGDLDWDSDASAEEIGRVNDFAYGYPEGEGVAPALGAPGGFAVRCYRARSEGELAAVLATLDIGSDCVIIWVATLPEHRGRRLASRLLAAALGEARERGLETTTLQASMLGRGVYERLGYELVAPLQLYERRVGSGT